MPIIVPKNEAVRFDTRPTCLHHPPGTCLRKNRPTRAGPRGVSSPAVCFAVMMVAKRGYTERASRDFFQIGWEGKLGETCGYPRKARGNAFLGLSAGIPRLGSAPGCRAYASSRISNTLESASSVIAFRILSVRMASRASSRVSSKHSRSSPSSGCGGCVRLASTARK
jgi:hypothetical protein